MFGGFSFVETMVGTFRPVSGEERAMHFHLRVRAESFLRYLRDRKAHAEGDVTMDGFATDAAVVGELTIDPILGRRIAYSFEFSGDDGKRYRLAGQKDITPLRPVESMTVLPAQIFDERGDVIATADLKFPLDELPKFLASWRPW
jgi:hypothetical protein